MNGAHLHLLINHFSLIGLVFGILFLALAQRKNGNDYLKAALWILALSGLATIITYLTGEPAEDVLKNLPNFPEAFVEEHEKAAQFALIFMCITGVTAAFTLWKIHKKKVVAKALKIALIVLAIFTLTVVSRTSFLGGQISHPEIRGQ